MKKGSRKGFHCRVVGLGIACLAIFYFSTMLQAATVVIANLTVAPAPTVKPGSVLKFQTDVFYNAKFNEPAGTMMRVFVTRSDFSWVSDKLDIKYPGMGSVHVNFNNGFTIPANAKNGEIFDFYLVYGPWYVLSNKASVKVFHIKNTIPLPGQVKKLCCISGKYAGSHILTAKPNCPPPVKETFTMVIKQKEPCAAAIGGTITDASGTVSRWTGTLSPGLRGCCLLEGSSISPSGDTVKFKGTICLTLGKWKIKGTWEESGSSDPCRGSGTWEASQI